MIASTTLDALRRLLDLTAAILRTQTSGLRRRIDAEAIATERARIIAALRPEKTYPPIGDEAVWAGVTAYRDAVLAIVNGEEA